MKKNLLIALALLITLSPALVSQTKSDTPDLTMWRGGKISFNAGLGLNMLGVGTGSAIGGGVISPRLDNGAASVFTNPAELASMTSPQLIVDSKFGIGSGTFGLTGDKLLSAATIREQTDSFLKDSSVFRYDNANGFKRYSTLTSGSVGMVGQVNALTAAFPIGRGVTLALGSYYPIDVSMNMRLSDLSMQLKANRVSGTQTIAIDFLLNMAVAADLQLQSNVMNVGAGWKALEWKKGSLSVGAAAKRYDTRARIGLDVPIDGLISIQKNEYYFNNPDDKAIDFANGETNKLKWTASGDYRDTKWGFSVGAYYDATKVMNRIFSAFNVSVLYDYSPVFAMNDPNAKSESYQPVFLVGKPGGTGTDSMQVLIDSLRLSKPNLTRSTHNMFSDRIDFRQPSSLTLGLDLGLGAHTVIVNYVKYFGEYSMTFGDYTIGKKAESAVKFAADFTLSDRLEGWNWALLPVRLLYLDIDGLLMQAFQSHTGYHNAHYRLGGGVMFGTPIVNGLGSEETAKSLRDGLTTPIPLGFSLGRQYTIYERFTVGVMVFGYPDLAFKTSVGIEL